MSGTRGRAGADRGDGARRWRWRCCCWRRRGEGRQVRRRPVRLVRRRRRRLGRHHRRRQVPPRRLLRAAGRRRPLRRRPPEELHPRRPGRRSRGTRFARWRWERAAGTGDHPGARHLVARPPRRHASSGSAAVDLGRRLRPLRGRRRHRHGPARVRRAASSPPQPAFEDRLLCARGREQVVHARAAGSWSALRALTITVEDDRAPAAWTRRRAHWPAAGGAASSALDFAGGDAGGGVRFGETTLDGARVDLTEYPCAKALIGGEWRATRMQPCLTSVAGAARRSTPPGFSDGPHTARPLRHRLRRQRRLHSRRHGRRSTTTRRPIRATSRSPAARAGGGSTTSTSPGPTPTRARRARSAAPTGGSSAPPATTPASSSPPAATSPRSPTARCPAPGAYSLQLWLRDEAGNDEPRLGGDGAAALRRRAARRRLRAGRRRGRASCRAGRAEVSDAHSGPGRGQILYRRLDAERWIELPTQSSTAEATPSAASLVARDPASLAPGTYVFRADAVDAAGNAASTHAARRRHRDGDAQAAAAAAGRAAGRRGQLPPPGARRGSSPACAAATVAATRSPCPSARPPLLSGRLTRADGAGLAGRELRVVSRPSRGALAARRGGDGPDRASTAASSCGSPPGPRAGSPSSSPATAGLEPARRGDRWSCGCAAASRSPPRRGSLRTGAVGAPRRPGPRSRRADAAARQAGRDPVPGGGDRGAGARSSSPAATTAAASAPATASAT